MSDHELASTSKPPSIGPRTTTIGMSAVLGVVGAVARLM
jgi:hypothetical protein